MFGFQAGSGVYSESSSINTELAEADSNAERSTFRESMRRNITPDVQEPDATTPKTVNVHEISLSGDIIRDTPESTASSTRHFFMRNDGSAGFMDRGRLQQNALGTTMRGVVGGVHLEAENDSPMNIRETKKDPLSSNEIKLSKPFRLMILVGFVVILAGGMFLIIYLNKKTDSGQSKGQIIPDKEEYIPKAFCDDVAVKLGDIISVLCPVTKRLHSSPSRLRVTPPVYVNKGDSFTINIVPPNNDPGDSGWTAKYEFGDLIIRGPNASCSSDGVYKIEIVDIKNRNVSVSPFRINVTSEILKVNVSLSQTVGDDKTDFTIGCSTNSGCEQSFVDFFAEINKEERFLRGVNFSCTITYNDYDGYSVSCVGRIPDYLMAQFGRITCRPTSRLLDDLDEKEKKDLQEVLELPDCDVSKHCGYKCERPGDYYVVNSGRCDIFHRCFAMEVYTSYCAPGTFFDPFECTCRHTKDLSWCQNNGALRPNERVTKKTCDITNNNI